jgi:hypothetical protein
MTTSSKATEYKMPAVPKIFFIVAMVGWAGSSAAFAAKDFQKLVTGGAWNFRIEERGHPELGFSKDGKNVFYVGCGRAFGLHAVYPGIPKRLGGKANITIANSSTRMTFTGEVESAHDDDPPGTAHFVQWDLGFRRQDPDLFGKRWKRLERRFVDLLDSGQPLMISAGGRGYTLPPANAANWKKQFTDIC